MTQLVNLNDFVVDGINRPMPGLALHTIYQQLPLGTTSVALNIPAGFAWSPISTAAFWNPTTSANTISAFLVRAGISYVVRTIAAFPANISGGVLTTRFNAVSGDTLSVITTAAGAVLNLIGVLVPTSVPLKLVSRVLALGNNTLYTCPAGKVAYIATTFSNNLIGFMDFANHSGGSRIVSAHIVPVAGVPDATNIRLRATPANDGVSLVTFLGKLVAGESLVVVTDGGANQMAWTCLWEEPA